MGTERGLLFLYTETPLHVGAGSDTGYVDLPIQRERMSGHPVVPGSGIRGSLRELFSGGGGKPEPVELALFGPRAPEAGSDEQEQNQGQGQNNKTQSTWAGALSLGDARLLLFPMRSAKGGWAWVTCPMVLDRLQRDIHRVVGDLSHPLNSLLDSLNLLPIARVGRGDGWYPVVSKTCTLLLEGDLVLEDQHYDKVKQSEEVGKLGDALAKMLPPGPGYAPFRQRLPDQLVIVSDSDFGDFVQQFTEVVTRVKMDEDTGAVKKGGLWTEENLPSESLLYAPVEVTESRRPSNGDEQWPTAPNELLGKLIEKMDAEPYIGLGGNRGVGRGLVGVNLVRRLAEEVRS